MKKLADLRETAALRLSLAAILLLAFLSAIFPYIVMSQQDYVIFEYGSSGCPHCSALHQFLLDKYGEEHHIFCDIATNDTCAQYFAKFLSASKLPGYVPQTFVFKEGKLMAMVIGEIEDVNFWNNILSQQPSDNITIYYGGEPAAYLYLPLDKHDDFVKEFVPEPYASRILEGGGATSTHTTSSTTTAAETTTQQTMTAAPGTTSASTTIPGSNAGESALFAALIPLALADSVNPCTFILYSIILVSVSVAGGRKKILAVGVSFIVAVFIAYLALGLALTQVATLIPKLLLVAVAGGYAALMIADSLLIIKGVRGKNVCREDDPECKATKLARFFQSHAGVVGAFGLGLMASFTLLPCSAGPYVVFATLISLASFADKLALLAAYVAVFVTPLVMILLAMIGVTKLRNVRDALASHQAEISLVAGILLMGVAAYVALAT